MSGSRPTHPVVVHRIDPAAHDWASSAKTPASTNWDLGAIPPPTSTPIWSGAARVTPIRPALQPPAALMVFMALYPRPQRPAEPAGSVGAGHVPGGGV
jgi:hypothetical protein